MTQQEIEEAIKQTEELIIDFDLSGDDRNPLNKLINLAELHLSIMKSGMPKKKIYPGTSPVTDPNLPIRIIGEYLNDHTRTVGEDLNA